MPATINFDVTRDAYVEMTAERLFIRRQLIVSGLTIAAGTSDPSLILQAFGVSGFPSIGTLYPGYGTSGPALKRVVVRSVDRSKTAVDCNLEYEGAPLVLEGGGGIFFTITQQPSTSSVQQYMTSDGSNPLEMWYQVGADGSAPSGPPAGADIRNINVQKLRCTEILRASATASASTWNSVRDNIRATRENINSDNWGGYVRGYWLFLGATTRTLDSQGNNLFIQLDFAGDERLWFPTGVYRDQFGNIPQDIDPESALDSPAEGFYKQGNGVGKYSIYKETEFSGLFGFTPTG